jgi:hypothetical protein
MIPGDASPIGHVPPLPRIGMNEPRPADPKRESSVRSIIELLEQDRVWESDQAGVGGGWMIGRKSLFGLSAGAIATAPQQRRGRSLRSPSPLLSPRPERASAVLPDSRKGPIKSVGFGPQALSGIDRKIRNGALLIHCAGGLR